MKRVAEVMTAQPVSVALTTSVEDAERLAHLRNVRHLLVMQDATLRGIVCACDLRGEASWSPVTTWMSAPVHTISDQASIEEAGRVMASRGIGCLPVLAGGRVVGVVTRGDLRRAGLSFEEELGGHFCAACGAHHDVMRDARMSEVWFCEDCEECARTRTDEAFGEVLGGGD